MRKLKFYGSIVAAFLIFFGFIYCTGGLQAMLVMMAVVALFVVIGIFIIIALNNQP